MKNFIIAINRWIADLKSALILSKVENDEKVFQANKQKYGYKISMLGENRKLRFAKIESGFDKKLLFRSRLYSLISFLGTIGSIMLTLCGITGDSWKHLLDTAQNVTYVILICFIQFSVWTIATNETYIKENMYKHFTKLMLLLYSSTAVSIICNYIFLINFQKPRNVLYYFFLFVLASSIDLISLVFAGLANDCRWNKLSKPSETLGENQTILHMIIFNATMNFRLKIRQKYIEGLKKYETVFTSENMQISSDEKTPILLENKTVSNNISSDENAVKTMACTSQIRNETETDKRVLAYIQTETKPKRFTDEIKSVKVTEPKRNRNETKSETETKPKRKIVPSETKTETKRNDNTYDRLLSEIKKMDADEMITLKDLKTKVSAADWRKCRDKMVNHNIIYTKNSRTYKK